MDGGVNGERDEISEAVDGATEEVESGAEVGDGGGGEGADGGEDGFGFELGSDVEGLGFGGEREVADERRVFAGGGCEGGMRREIDMIERGLAADRHWSFREEREKREEMILEMGERVRT